MITISANLKAHLASGSQTVCQLLKITWADETDSSGPTVKAFARHDADLVLDGVTYLATNIDDFSDIASACDLSVDNGEATGVLTSPAITEADLRAGLWDYAKFELSLVNWKDLTQGQVILRSGQIGKVSAKRNQFTAEHRSKLQFFSTTLGELTQPGCRAEFGDARCAFDRESTRVTGTIDSVSNDGLTFKDSARSEAGPGGSTTAITHITNANPGVVTVADGSILYDGEAIMLSGILGPTLLNTTGIVRGLSGNTFNLGIDTSDTSVFPAYISGGTVTPLGAGSGTFDFGLMRMESGPNAGFEREVRAYIVGQWTVELPFPYTVTAGQSYSMTEGCDKSFDTCQNRFNNVVHFRGEPDLPGLDKIAQVGTQP